MNLQTQCPHFGVKYEIESAQLDEYLKCGQCGEAFTAKVYREDSAPNGTNLRGVRRFISGDFAPGWGRRGQPGAKEGRLQPRVNIRAN